MDNLASVGIYAGTIGLIAIAMVNPGGNRGLSQEWKALILFGVIPSMIKTAAMTGQAQLSTNVIAFSCGMTVALHLLLREMSPKYKQAFKNPSAVTSREAFMTWSGITLVYAMVLTGSMLLFKKYNSSSVIKRVPAPAPAPFTRV